MDISQHSAHHETVHLIANLDELERKLFFVGQLSFRSFKVSFQNVKYFLQSCSHSSFSLLQEWIRRESSKINTAALVASHRKRKFAEMTV